MIRINLLGVARPVAARVAGPPPTAAKQAIMFVGSLVVALVIVGAFYWIWNNEVKRLTTERDEQKREAERLAQIRAEVQRYNQQRQQLEQRINTIQMLQNTRVGPADFMTALGNTVNRVNELYLLAVNPEGGNRIALRGQANSVQAIANFITELKRSDRFQDVQLRQYFQDDDDSRRSFKFNIDMVYKLPQAPAPEKKPAAAPAGPGARAAM
ncbi:MAG: PilN domain-containing protein [Acidobacteria bacterium]|nr:PilN domain-containing protein [Acidobacteriota bacterium]